MFWTSEMQWLGAAMLAALAAMIILPIAFKVVDELLGYFFLALGGGMLWLSMRLGVVTFEDGEFVQAVTHGHPEGLHTILGEAKILIACYFVLSFLAIVFKARIEKGVLLLTKRMPPYVLVGLWTLLVGSMGSISVVVMAVLGGIFFRTLQGVSKRDLTPSVVWYSAAIGISALLTTIGEPLSLFIARNLGESTPYLLRTYTGFCALNVIACAAAAAFLASRAAPLPETTEEAAEREVHEAEAVLPGMSGNGAKEEVREAFEAVEKLEHEQHDLTHETVALVNRTANIYVFVLGLLFFGESVKPIASHLFSSMHPMLAFFVNAISAVADNALLGLLEVQPGMSQESVLIIGISLAFWGVGLVPGNVCNVVLKDQLGIRFGTWARHGIPAACVLAAFNLVLLLLGAGKWLTF